MKRLAYWVPISNLVLDAPGSMDALVRRSRQEARAAFLNWGWVPVGEWRERVSDQHADLFIQNRSVLLVENLAVVPLPGFRGWYRRTRQTWRRKVYRWRNR